MLSSLGIERLFIFADLLSSRGGWLEGQPFTVIMALTYGYLPFLILPLYAVARPDRPAADRGGA